MVREEELERKEEFCFELSHARLRYGKALPRDTTAFRGHVKLDDGVSRLRPSYTYILLSSLHVSYC